MIKVSLISIGDELLFGLTPDTNFTHIGQQLAAIGLPLARQMTAADDLREICQALEICGKTAEIVIVMGGLGPTSDDVTRHAVAQFLNVPLESNPEAMAQVRSFFEKHNKTMSDSNRIQAMLPKGTRTILNERGTAPGIKFSKDGSLFYVLPGVPREMKHMLERFVIPEILELGSNRSVVRSRTLRTVSIPESVLYDRVKNVVDGLRDTLKVAFLPHLEIGVDIRLTAYSEDVAAAERQIEDAEKMFRETIGEHIFGIETQTLENAVAGLLSEQKKTVACAESCTGGALSDKLTNVPGSSDYFLMSVTAYSNPSKVALLGVRNETLESYGAVSEQTAAEMAEGIRQRAGTDFGLSTTGIAGPGGATTTKPVGLVFIGLASTEDVTVRQFRLTKNRMVNKMRAANFALELLRHRLLGLAPERF